MIYWFFGIPGSGKSYLAEQFSNMIDVPVFEGDDFHTAEDRQAIAEGRFTLADRHAQLNRINLSLKAMKGRDAIVTHPLPDKVSRAVVRGENDDVATLVYAKAPLSHIQQRLKERTNHHFTSDLLDAWLPRHWQEPEDEDCFVIENVDTSVVETRLKELRNIYQ